MKEIIGRIEAKTGQSFTVDVYNQENLTAEKRRKLAIKYATDFWAGSWKELLKDTRGNQYGTADASGEIYPETATLLRINGINATQADWPRVAWQKAGDGTLISPEGEKLQQFWTLAEAEVELASFVAPIEKEGFGGELLVITDEMGDIAGFTAYTVGSVENGPTLAHQRFSYNILLIDGQIKQESFADTLSSLYPQQRLGIFLDFAVSERYRGAGLGSVLFDMRMERLVAMGADVIIGRTIKTSPSQYYGNYIARGMQEIAFDVDNSNKALFGVLKNDIRPRRERDALRT